MDALDALLTRTSVKRTTDPAPDDSDLHTLLGAALRAPDHKCLRPWRFIVVRGDARDRLGEIFAQALAAREPDCPPEALERERMKTRRAPLLLVVVMRPRDVPGVPVVEQILSAGAAAENVLLAAHALGYGGMWRTGAAAYDPVVQGALGLAASESIAGFLYLGTPGDAPARTRPAAAPEVEEWTGA